MLDEDDHTIFEKQNDRGFNAVPTSWILEHIIVVVISNYDFGLTHAFQKWKVLSFHRRLRMRETFSSSISSFPTSNQSVIIIQSFKQIREIPSITVWTSPSLNHRVNKVVTKHGHLQKIHQRYRFKSPPFWSSFFMALFKWELRTKKPLMCLL